MALLLSREGEARRADADADLQFFITTHGMHRLRPYYDRVNACQRESNLNTLVHITDSSGRKIRSINMNGFACAAIYGVRASIERAKLMLDTCSIIAALMLAFVLPLLVDLDVVLVGCVGCGDGTAVQLASPCTVYARAPPLQL